MKLSVSTCWNCHRHRHGEPMIEEILDAGADGIELGYGLEASMVPGVKRLVDSGDAAVGSVHNYCPIPSGRFAGHPELYSLSSKSRRERHAAVHYTTQSLRFAGEVGASFLVLHCGRVKMRSYTPKLAKLFRKNQAGTRKHERIRHKLLTRRRRAAPKNLSALRESLEALMPISSETGVKLALENLPSWEAIPLPHEFIELRSEFGDDQIYCWHDMGHAQILENLGLLGHLETLNKLLPFTGGMHVHDALPPDQDHLAPPTGNIPFPMFAHCARTVPHLVLEPNQTITPQILTRAITYLREIWGES